MLQGDAHDSTQDLAQDRVFMQAALDEAQRAWQAGEVPVGAVVVYQGEIIARGHNHPIGSHDPSAHAEMQALRAAAARLGNYRLPECDVYVTLEPCVMCAGAMLHARIRRVVYGADDPKTGACGSIMNLFAESRLNHQTTVSSGCCAEACGQVLKDFFAERRAQRKAPRDV